MRARCCAPPRDSVRFGENTNSYPTSFRRLYGEKEAVRMSLSSRSLCVILLLAASLSVAQQFPAAPPANPLLVNHKNWFVPAQVWDIQKDPSLAKYRPANLTYSAYSAVGYSMANTIAIIGPNHEIVIIDTLENLQSAQAAIAAFRAAKIFPEGPLPIRAIIYTHNPTDH